MPELLKSSILAAEEILSKPIGEHNRTVEGVAAIIDRHFRPLVAAAPEPLVIFLADRTDGIEF